MSKSEKIKRTHLSHFHIAGFAYYEGVIVFSKLEIGTILKLERESENRHDKYAISIYFEETKLGFIPRGENKILSKFMDSGFNKLEIRVNQVDRVAHPEQQVGVILYLLAS